MTQQRTNLLKISGLFAVVFLLWVMWALWSNLLGFYQWLTAPSKEEQSLATVSVPKRSVPLVFQRRAKPEKRVSTKRKLVKKKKTDKASARAKAAALELNKKHHAMLAHALRGGETPFPVASKNYISVGKANGKKFYPVSKKIAQHKQSHCMHPKWSSDGNTLAYEVHFVKKRQIQLFLLNRGKSKPVLLQRMNKGAMAREFSWHPKKNTGVYTSNMLSNVLGLYLLRRPVRASSPLKSDGQPHWSSNGKFIAFTSGRSGKGDIYFTYGSFRKARRLTKYPDSTEMYPRWSPKNRLQLAFVRHTDQNNSIYVMNNIFTKKSHPLTKSQPKLSQLNFSWSPDGRFIAYFAQASNGRYDIYVSSLNGNTQRIASHVVKSDQLGPAWSPDSRKIIYAPLLPQKTVLHSVVAVDIRSKQSTQIFVKHSVMNELAVKADKKTDTWTIAYTAKPSPKPGLVYRNLYTITIPMLK